MTTTTVATTTTAVPTTTTTAVPVTTPEPFPYLIKEGLMMRWFAWDDPDSARADSFGQNKTIDVNNTTSSRDVLYPSYQSSLWPDLTGAFTNDSYITDFDTFAKGETDAHGVTKSGLYLTDAQWLQLPQLQTDNKGGQLDEFGNKVDFLTGNVYGWTITYWAKTKWPSSSYDPTVYDEDYQWFNIGKAGNANSLAHFIKYEGTEVEGVLRGTHYNFVYAGEYQSQPPDPILQGTGEFWTFYAISYGGGKLGGDKIVGSIYKTNDILWAAGTGSPSTSSLRLYSGDVDSVPAGFDDGLRVRGDSMHSVGDDPGNTWLNLDDKNAFVFGSGGASSVVSPITGYISDFRLYSGQLNTGQIKNIYLGRENMPEEICVDGATNPDSALVQAHDGTYVIQDSLYNNNLWWKNANNWSIKNSNVVFFISHEGDGNSYSAYLTANKQSPTDYAGNWLAAGGDWTDGENLTVVQGTCAPTTTVVPTTTTAGPTTTTVAPTTTTAIPVTTPEPSPKLLKDGLRMRMFGWNDPDVTNDFVESANVQVPNFDGTAGLTDLTVDVIKSSYNLSAYTSVSISGLLLDANVQGADSSLPTYYKTGITDIHGITKTGYYINNPSTSTSETGRVLFSQISEIESPSADRDKFWNELNGAFEFLTGGVEGSAAEDVGWTFTYWYKNMANPKPLGGDWRRTSWWKIGNASNWRGIGLLSQSDGRFAWTNEVGHGIYADDLPKNPPNPLDMAETGSQWTFMSMAYGGGAVSVDGNDGDDKGGNVVWAVGTGGATLSKDNLFFYSGDGTDPALDGSIGVQGGTFAQKAGRYIVPYDEPWIGGLDEANTFVLGALMQGDGEMYNYTQGWTGAFHDFRIYSGALNTGQVRDIYTGQGLV